MNSVSGISLRQSNLAEVSVEHAKRAEFAVPLEQSLRTYANALHQAGNRVGAWAIFRHAETMQSKGFGQPPLLYSLRGSHYCDFLLASAEIPAWRRRAGVAATEPGVTQRPGPSDRRTFVRASRIARRKPWVGRLWATCPR